MGLFYYLKVKGGVLLQSIKLNKEFQAVFTSGKWFGAECLVIYIKENHKSINRIGIAVGKKIAKSVMRNRIRRVIREAYRLQENTLKKGYDIVIVWKNGIDLEKVKYDIVSKDLTKALQKADLLKNE